MELLDIYNEKRELTGKNIYRANLTDLKENEFYLCVRAWIVTSNQDILIIKRNKNKPQGGMWENIGGCAQSGEQPKEAIIREIFEEVGIKTCKEELKLLKVEKGKDFFKEIFFLKKNIVAADIKIDLTEVEDFKLIKLEELKQLIEENKINTWALSSLEELYINL